MIRSPLAVAFAAVLLFQSAPGVTITGARIVDGTGAVPRVGNVRIEGSRIASVGDVKPRDGDVIVDGRGLAVAPGFIDIHNHSTTALLQNPAAETQVAQGITTLVVGADGSSPWPIAAYLAERRKSPAAVNVMVMVGHATVRRQVMKDDYKRPARDEEIARMAALVEQGMTEGAIGLSSGLEYEVGSYSETKELVELAKAAARHGGFYMSHIRDEADRAFEAFTEAIAIGEQARIPVQISHIKLGTVGVWRKSADVVRMVEAARLRGVDVTADCYPYDAWHSTITVLVPNKQYEDPVSVKKALDDVGGAQNVMIDRDRAHPEYEFKTLDAIAKAKGITPVELFIQIVKDGGASVVGKSMVEEDIRRFYSQPWVMVGSDGGIGLRHPRSAGSFPRVLAKFVREQNWFPLQEAIRKMTAAPAARLKLADRGTIAAGKVADLVLFDPATVTDRSTFQEPFLLATGVTGVWVSGVRVWDGGKPTGAVPGQMLTRDTKTAAALPSSEQRGARMNVDRYTKGVLTVIAGCLLWICAMGTGPSLSAQSAAVEKIRHSSIQPVLIVGTGTVDQEGTVTVNFVRDRDRGGPPHTDPTLPILLPYTPAKPLPVSLPYTPANPMPSVVLNPDDVPVPMEIMGVRKPEKWDPLRVRVEDAPAKPRPGGGER